MTLGQISANQDMLLCTSRAAPVPESVLKKRKRDQELRAKAQAERTDSKKVLFQF